MKSPILISLDSNEQGSERAKALALACGGDPTYELQGFAELPVDMKLEIIQECPQCRGKPYPDEEYEGEMRHVMCGVCCDAGKVLHSVQVELKEIPDFWASKSSGHLGQQILQMISDGQPGFVAVFGSLQEVLAGVPEVSTPKGPHAQKATRRSQFEIDQDMNTARAFCADATACSVPVFFLSTNHQQSFAWILSLAKNILTGPNLSSWLPRFPVDPRGYGCLCAIPGVGDVAAKGLLQAYGGLAQIANEAKCNPTALAACRVNGKALGKSKAAKIVEVLA